MVELRKLTDRMIVRVSEQNIMNAASIHSSDTPSLWIFEKNINAERLYYRMGFTRTGRINTITDKIAEIELSLKIAVAHSRDFSRELAAAPFI